LPSKLSAKNDPVPLRKICAASERRDESRSAASGHAAFCNRAGLGGFDLQSLSPGCAHGPVVPVMARSMLEEHHSAMTDVIFVSITIAFFAVAWLYVRACERL
jgi:hypothetical protein